MNARRALVSCVALAAFAACATGENLDSAVVSLSDSGIVPSAGGATSSSTTDANGMGGASESGGASADGGAGPGAGGSSKGGASDGSVGTGGAASTLDSGQSDGATEPACPDPAQKSCNGVCSLPSPAVGCAQADCTACTAVPNGFPQCTAGACDFGCLSGYQRSGSGCSVGGGGSGGGGGAGGSGGAAGAAGAAGAGGGGGNPCTNGTKDGAETDVDCGGGTCAKCSDTKVCSAAGDCVSGVCARGSGTTRHCQPATCSDTVKNASETDVDCGGNCGATCAPGKACGGNGDCSLGPCNGGVCGCTPLGQCPAGKCGQVANNCGGNLDCSTNCSSGDVCNAGACCTPVTTCAAGQCNSVPDKCGGTISCPGCTAPETCGGGGVANQCGNQCGDGKKDGSETDVDCGGGTCSPCAGGKSCSGNGDCASNSCKAGCILFICLGPKTCQ